MIRFLTTVTACLLLVGAAPAADAKKLILQWHGQSFFDLETSKGTKVIFDPHAIENYGRNQLAADLVLISHFHNDHTMASEVLTNPDKAKIIQGLVKSDKGKKDDWNPVDEQFKDIRVRSVGVYHDEQLGMERGKNTVFVLEVDGLRIVHLGDLGHELTDEQIKKIKKGGDVDVLLIPVGGIYTLNGADAKKVVDQLKPKMYVVPMHFGTKAFDQVLPVDEIVDNWDAEFVRKTSKTNKLVIETDFKTKQPILAVLNWRDEAPKKEKEK
jgi:L-ascorbate metabolism protein UlaG (beta-lactamase superfamily)